MPSNESPLNFDDSRRARARAIEVKAIGRNLGARLAGRAIGVPKLGRNRRGRNDRDIDIPTAGVPGTRTPTGSNFDPDRDGWVDEGTTRPRFIGTPKVPVRGKKPRQASQEEREQQAAKQRIVLTSGGTIAQWKKVGAQTGSNPGGFYEDENGVRHYVKWPKTALHAESEALANALYQLAGISVPKTHTSRDATGATVMTSRIADGRSLDFQNLTPAQLEEVKNGFLIDAWLANWDSILDGNIVGNNKGKVTRIDSGGALLFRANGERKGDGTTIPFDDKVSELDAMRDKNRAAAADVFSKITDSQLKEQARNFAFIDPDEISAIVDRNISDGKESRNLQKTLLARRKAIIDKFGVEDPFKDRKSSSQRLSSGQVPEETKRRIRHRQASYSYGDTSELNGKPIRAYHRGWLGSLTSEQIAELIVPDSAETSALINADRLFGDIAFARGTTIQGLAREFLIGNGFRSEQITESNIDEAIETLRTAFRDKVIEDRLRPRIDGGQPPIDYSPEVIQVLRERVKDALDSSPGLKWAFEQFGAPTISVPKADVLGTSDRGYELAATSLTNGMLITKALIVSMRGVERQRGNRDYGRYLPSLAEQLSDVITHEYGHYLGLSLDQLLDAPNGARFLSETNNPLGIENTVFQSGHFDREPFGEVITAKKAIEWASLLHRIDGNPSLERLLTDQDEEAVQRRANKNFDNEYGGYGVASIYGHSSLSEMFAEAMVAVLDEDSEMEKGALTDELSKAVRLVLGISLKKDDRPWLEHRRRERSFDIANGIDSDRKDRGVSRRRAISQRESRGIDGLPKDYDFDRLSSGARNETEIRQAETRGITGEKPRFERVDADVKDPFVLPDGRNIGQNEYVAARFPSWVIGDERIVFSNPRFGKPDGSFKRVARSVPAITGLAIDSQDGFEMAQKYTAALYAVRYTEFDNTYADALMYAASRGDADARSTFEELASLGERFLKEDRQASRDSVVVSEEEIRRSPIARDMTVDDLWIFHESPYEFIIEDNGDLIIRPAGQFETWANNGVRRPSIHTALNHIVKPIMERPGDKSYGVVAFKLTDALEHNPGTLEGLALNDTFFIPKPGEPLRIPKGKFKIRKYDPSRELEEQRPEVTESIGKEIPGFRAFDRHNTEDPGPDNLVRKISKELDAVPKLHTDTHLWLDMTFRNRQRDEEEGVLTASPSQDVRNVPDSEKIFNWETPSTYLFYHFSPNARANFASHGDWSAERELVLPPSQNPEDDRLFSGGTQRPTQTPKNDIPKKPSYPRTPTLGAFVGGAGDVFGSARTWDEFWEIYKGRDIVFLDYETTGLVFDAYRRPSSNGQPTQIGAVKVRDGKIVARFNLFMNPNEPLGDWSRENLRDPDGNPLTDDWLAEQISIEEAHRQFVEFAGPDAIIGVQNAAFDKRVLDDALDASGITWRPLGYIDTKEIADVTLPKWTLETGDGPYITDKDGNKKPSNGLAAITAYLGVDLGSKHHTADADAEAAAEVMERIARFAIERGWSRDVLDPRRRADKMASDTAKFDRDLAQFHKDVAAYESTLSSGRVHSEEARQLVAQARTKMDELKEKYPDGIDSAIEGIGRLRNTGARWEHGPKENRELSNEEIEILNEVSGLGELLARAIDLETTAVIDNVLGSVADIDAEITGLNALTKELFAEINKFVSNVLDVDEEIKNGLYWDSLRILNQVVGEKQQENIANAVDLRHSIVESIISEARLFSPFGDESLTPDERRRRVLESITDADGNIDRQKLIAVISQLDRSSRNDAPGTIQIIDKDGYVVPAYKMIQPSSLSDKDSLGGQVRIYSHDKIIDDTDTEVPETLITTDELGIEKAGPRPRFWFSDSGTDIYPGEMDRAHESLDELRKLVRSQFTRMLTKEAYSGSLEDQLRSVGLFETGDDGPGLRLSDLIMELRITSMDFDPVQNKFITKYQFVPKFRNPDVQKEWEKSPFYPKILKWLQEYVDNITNDETATTISDDELLLGYSQAQIDSMSPLQKEKYDKEVSELRDKILETRQKAREAFGVVERVAEQRFGLDTLLDDVGNTTRSVLGSPRKAVQEKFQEGEAVLRRYYQSRTGAEKEENEKARTRHKQLQDRIQDLLVEKISRIQSALSESGVSDELIRVITRDTGLTLEEVERWGRSMFMTFGSRESFIRRGGALKAVISRSVLANAGVAFATADDLRQKIDPDSEDLTPEQEYVVLKETASMIEFMPLALLDGSSGDHVALSPSDFGKPEVGTGSRKVSLSILVNSQTGRQHATNMGVTRDFSVLTGMGEEVQQTRITTVPVPAGKPGEIRSWKSIQGHETWHGVTYANEWIRVLEHLEWIRRAKEEDVRALAQIAGEKQERGGYDPWEVGVRDEWGSTYSGKIYDNDTYGRGTFAPARTTEIGTVGFQGVFFGDEKIDDQHRHFFLGMILTAQSMSEQNRTIREREEQDGLITPEVFDYPVRNENDRLSSGREDERHSPSEIDEIEDDGLSAPPPEEEMDGAERIAKDRYKKLQNDLLDIRAKLLADPSITDEQGESEMREIHEEMERIRAAYPNVTESISADVFAEGSRRREVRERTSGDALDAALEIATQLRDSDVKAPPVTDEMEQARRSFRSDSARAALRAAGEEILKTERDHESKSRYRDGNEHQRRTEPGNSYFWGRVRGFFAKRAHSYKGQGTTLDKDDRKLSRDEGRVLNQIRSVGMQILEAIKRETATRTQNLDRGDLSSDTRKAIDAANDARANIVEPIKVERRKRFRQAQKIVDRLVFGISRDPESGERVMRRDLFEATVAVAKRLVQKNGREELGERTLAPRGEESFQYARTTDGSRFGLIRVKNVDLDLRYDPETDIGKGPDRGFHSDVLRLMAIARSFLGVDPGDKSQPVLLRDEMVDSPSGRGSFQQRLEHLRNLSDDELYEMLKTRAWTSQRRLPWVPSPRLQAMQDMARVLNPFLRIPSRVTERPVREKITVVHDATIEHNALTGEHRHVVKTRITLRTAPGKPNLEATITDQDDARDLLRQLGPGAVGMLNEREIQILDEALAKLRANADRHVREEYYRKDSPFMEMGEESRKELLVDTVRQAVNSASMRAATASIDEPVAEMIPELQQQLSDIGIPDDGSFRDVMEKLKNLENDVHRLMARDTELLKRVDRTKTTDITPDERRDIAINALKALGVEFVDPQAINVQFKIPRSVNISPESLERAERLIRRSLGNIPASLISGESRNGNGKLEVIVTLKPFGQRRAAAQLLVGSQTDGVVPVLIHMPMIDEMRDEDFFLNWESKGTHEVGHGVEYANPDIAILEFLEFVARAGSEELLDKNEVRPTSKSKAKRGAAEPERFIRDKWGQYYAGKWYADLSSRPQGRIFEILTTGLQAIFYGGPGDDRHIEFTLGLLGLARLKQDPVRRKEKEGLKLQDDVNELVNKQRQLRNPTDSLSSGSNIPTGTGSRKLKFVPKNDPRLRFLREYLAEQEARWRGGLEVEWRGIDFIEKYDLFDGKNIYKPSEYGDGYPPDLDYDKARYFTETYGHRFVEFTDESGKSHLYYLRFEAWGRIQAFDVAELKKMFRNRDSQDWGYGTTYKNFRNREVYGSRIVAATMDIHPPSLSRNYWEIRGVETKVRVGHNGKGPVARGHRRRGLASALLKFFRDTYPALDIQHSKVLSEDGKKFRDATDIDKLTLASGRTGTGSKKLTIVQEDDERLGEVGRAYQYGSAMYKNIAPTDRSEVYVSGEPGLRAPRFDRQAALNYARAYGHRFVEFDDGSGVKKLYWLMVTKPDTVVALDVEKLNEYYADIEKRNELIGFGAAPSPNLPIGIGRDTGARAGTMETYIPATYSDTDPTALIDSPNWVIDSVEVGESHQRRGLASAMMKLYRDVFPETNLQHSDILTEEGAEFARATDIETITLASGGSAQKPVATDLVSPKARMHVERAKTLMAEIKTKYDNIPGGLSSVLFDLADERTANGSWKNYTLTPKEQQLLDTVNRAGAAINDAYTAELEARRGALPQEIRAIDDEMEELTAALLMLRRHLLARAEWSGTGRGRKVSGLNPNIIVPPFSNSVLSLTGNESISAYLNLQKSLTAQMQQAIERKIEFQKSQKAEVDITGSLIAQATSASLFKALGIETVRPDDIQPQTPANSSSWDDKVINVTASKSTKYGTETIDETTPLYKKITKGVAEVLLMIPRSLFFNDKTRHVPLNVRYVQSKARGHASETNTGVEIYFAPVPPVTSKASSFKQVEHAYWKSGVAHEVGHGIEFKSQWVRLLEFLEWSDRAKGEQPSQMRNFRRLENLRPDEMGVKDEWKMAYSGKIYARGRHEAPTFEILTNGLEDILYGSQPMMGIDSQQMYDTSRRQTDDRHRSFVFGVIAVAQQLQDKAPADRLSSGLIKDGAVDQEMVGIVAERIGKGIAKARQNNASVEIFDDIDSDDERRGLILKGLRSEITSMVLAVVELYIAKNNISSEQAEDLRKSYRERRFSDDTKLEELLDPLYTMQSALTAAELASKEQQTAHLFVARDGFGNLSGVAVIRKSKITQDMVRRMRSIPIDRRNRMFELGVAGGYMVEYIGAINPGAPDERAGGIGRLLFRDILARAADEELGLSLYPANGPAEGYWEDLGFGQSNFGVFRKFFMEPQAVRALSESVSRVDDRLSSGREEALKAHQSTEYKYGSRSALTGKPMRAYVPGWLQDLSSQQISRLLVPRNEDELIEMLVDEEIGRLSIKYGIDPEDMPEDQIAEIERDVVENLSNTISEEPRFQSEFEPEEIDDARDILEATLNAHPALMWAMQTFGAPPFRLGMDGDGAPGETPQIPASHVENAGITIFPTFSYLLGETIDPTAMPTRGSMLIDKTKPSSILHEWAHWFDMQLKAAGTNGNGSRALQPSHFDRRRFGEDTERDLAIRNATVFRRQEGTGMEDEIIDAAMKAHETDTFDPSSSLPGTLSRYGNMSLREMFAEGVVAVLHPNPEVERKAITKGLSVIVRYALGLPLDQDQRPWTGETNDRLSSGLVRFSSGLRKEDGQLDTEELDKVSSAIRHRTDAANRTGFSVETHSLREMTEYKRNKITKAILQELKDGPYGQYLLANMRDAWRSVKGGDDVLQREQLGLRLLPEHQIMDKDVLRTKIALNIMAWALLDARRRSEDENADHLIVIRNPEGQVVGIASTRKDNDGRQLMNVGTIAAKSGVGSMMFSEIVQLAASEDEQLYLGALRSARTYWSSLGFSPSNIRGLPDQSMSIDREAVQELASRLSSGGDADYRGDHTAPGRDSGAPLHDMSVLYPEDIYGPNAIQFYGTGDALDDRALALIRSMKGRPNATIRIYRAVPLTRAQTLKQLEDDLAYVKRTGKIPKGQRIYYSSNPTRSEYYERLTEEIERIKKLIETDGDASTSIKDGDWVSPFKEYVTEHGDSIYKSRKNYRIVSRLVRASDLFTAGDSWLEWGYSPKQSREDTGPIRLSSGLVKRDGSLNNEAIDDVAYRVSSRMYWLGDKKFTVEAHDVESMSDSDRAAFSRMLTDETKGFAQESKEIEDRRRSGMAGGDEEDDRQLTLDMLLNSVNDSASYATSIVVVRDKYGSIVGLMSMTKHGAYKGPSLDDSSGPYIEIRFAGATEQGSGVGSAMFAKAIEEASLKDVPINLISDYKAEDFWESLGFVVDPQSGMHTLPKNVVRELDSRIKERSERLASGGLPESAIRDIKHLDKFEEETGVKLHGSHLVIGDKAIPTVRNTLAVSTKANGDVQYYLEAFVLGEEGNLHKLEVHTHSKTGKPFYGLALSKNARLSENLDTFDVDEFVNGIDKHLANAFEFPPSSDVGEWEIMSENDAVLATLNDWFEKGLWRSILVQQYSPDTGFGEASTYFYDPIENIYVPSSLDGDSGRLASGGSDGTLGQKNLPEEARAVIEKIGPRIIAWGEPGVDSRGQMEAFSVNEAVLIDADNLILQAVNVPIDPALEQQAKSLREQLENFLRELFTKDDNVFPSDDDNPVSTFHWVGQGILHAIARGESNEQIIKNFMTSGQGPDDPSSALRLIFSATKDRSDAEMEQILDKLISLVRQVHNSSRALDKARMDASPTLSLWMAHNPSSTVRYPDGVTGKELKLFPVVPVSNDLPWERNGLLKATIATQIASDISALGVTDEDARQVIDLLGPIIGHSAAYIAETHKEATGRDISPVLLLADELVKQWARTSNDNAIPSIVAQLVAREVMPSLTGLGEGYQRHEDVKKFGSEEWQVISNADVLQIPKDTMGEAAKLAQNPLIKKVFGAALQSQWARSQEQMMRHADANGNVRIYRGMGHEELYREVMSQNPGHKVVRLVTDEDLIAEQNDAMSIMEKAEEKADEYNVISEEMDDVNDEIESLVDRIEDRRREVENEEDEDSREELNSIIQELLDELESASDKWDELQEKLEQTQRELEAISFQHEQAQSDLRRLMDEYDYERRRASSVQGRVSVQLFPLSSTAMTMGEAEPFGSEQYQVIIEADVPVRSIVSSACTGLGCLGEDELVISYPILSDIVANVPPRLPGEVGNEANEVVTTSYGLSIDDIFPTAKPNPKNDTRGFLR